MLFTSLEFFAFLLPTLIIYWATPQPFVRLVLLGIASLIFYAAGTAAHVLVLLVVSLVGYSAGLFIAARPQWGRITTAATIGVLVLNIAAFKYVAFLAHTVGLLWSVPWITSASLWAPVLPLGISFFTFEVIAYVVDVRSGNTVPERSPLHFFLYVAFFPHMVAGPIVRPERMLPQFDEEKRFHGSMFASGAMLFIEGIVKKVVIADTCGPLADRVFAAPAQHGTIAVWAGVLAYAVQIWGDFSGYTDMARGLARTFGYELPINFNQPYLARSPSDFWRRWHISLSTWLRDYMYIPLGGNRRGEQRANANLMATMAVGGLWHGANWTFVWWGIYHGALLILQRLARRWLGDVRLPAPMAVAATFILVLHGWILFRAPTLSEAAAVMRGMYGLTSGPAGGITGAVAGAGTLTVLRILMTAAAVAAGMWLVERRPAVRTWLQTPGVIQGALGAAGAAAAFYAYALGPHAQAPFIYFRF